MSEKKSSSQKANANADHKTEIAIIDECTMHDRFVFLDYGDPEINNKDNPVFPKVMQEIRL